MKKILVSWTAKREREEKWDNGCKTDFYRTSIELKHQLCCPSFFFFKHKKYWYNLGKTVLRPKRVFDSFVKSFWIFDGFNNTSYLESLHNSFTFTLHIIMQINNPTIQAGNLDNILILADLYRFLIDGQLVLKTSHCIGFE